MWLKKIKMYLSTSVEKLSVRKQGRSHHGEKFITDPGRIFILENGMRRKIHFLINSPILLLCDLEAGPKVHLQQLCLYDQLYISCNR